MSYDCPKCGEPQGMRDEDESHYPECSECGFIQYSPATLALIAEVRREFEEAKRTCWPDPVPSYREWAERGKTR